MLKVFIGVSESGVSFWRGKIPAWTLKKKGLCDLQLLNIYEHTPRDNERMISQSDVLYWPSPSGTDFVAALIQCYQMGKSTVVDFDDNLYDCHPFNPGYATLGQKEVRIKMPDGNEQYLWKDQRNGFSIRDNFKRFCSFTDIVNVSTAITTTTQYLKDRISENTTRPKDDIFVNPNSIDFSLFRPVPKKVKDHKKIRIGWAASDSHILEGRLTLDIYRELKRRRKDFTFVILGNIEKLRFSSVDYEIEWHEFVDLEVYPLKLASLELDIGICPLTDDSFNHSKSALKWSEYSAVGFPSVCSDVTPYKVIKDGKDGLLAKDVSSFVDKLELLMDNPKLRNDITQNSYDRNYSDFNIDKNCYKWLATFEKAHFKEHVLTYKGTPIVKNLENVVSNGVPA